MSTKETCLRCAKPVVGPPQHFEEVKVPLVGVFRIHKKCIPGSRYEQVRRRFELLQGKSDE